ncbi:acyl-CoA dehydrogenase [Streptomyces roseolilacinus]|uniref:Monooxygenase n=1 Tax=Streptomyces roseolilacinus TaxID=66904 RepID=A0A918EKE3_9ACTN|nr:acyl-CoA dehydrogenase [Streptomyces roseolilacinus]GGQ13256.1 monooxygenase [Streptomyces roseolilacinus]
MTPAATAAGPTARDLADDLAADTTATDTAAGPAALLRTARDLADDLAADAIPRDRAGRPPADEAARLREAGLPSALVPPGTGYGTDWRTGCAVVREVATADSSVGELLARHYALAWSTRLYGPPDRADALARDSARRRWLWAGALRYAAGPEEGGRPDLTLIPLGGTGHVLNGRRAVPAALAVADQLVVDAVCAVTGDVLVVRVAPGGRGVSVEAAGDRLGQRAAGAGAVVFDRVTVPPARLVGRRPPDEESAPPTAALAPSVLRLALCHVGLGIVEGALAEARDAVRTARRAGPPDGDPDLLLAYGELASAAHTAAAVVERATDATADALDAGPGLDADAPADVAALVATAETVTARAALQVTTRVLELADAPGLDRFWRNARVLTAHRSPTHRLRSIGDHYLNGTHRHVTAPCR